MSSRLHARGAVADPAAEIKHGGTVRQVRHKARQHRIAAQITDHLPVFLYIGGICRHRAIIRHALPPDP